MRYVVCAAIRRDGVVICGARHFDAVMRNVINELQLDFSNWEQGFIDDKGEWLYREAAWRIADAAGQIRRPTGYEDVQPGDQPRLANVGDACVLFSENLY